MCQKEVKEKHGELETFSWQDIKILILEKLNSPW